MATLANHHILYHNYFSICSIMVRYTAAIRGAPKDVESKILIEEQVVDIFNEEQLSEHFLCEINPLGQVPVLQGPSLSKHIADSLDITHYLAKSYPSLIPQLHKEQITRLLADLHALNFFSLSFPGREHVADGFVKAVEKRMEGNISDRYRDALLYKKEVLERDKVGGLKPVVTQEMNHRAKVLLSELCSLLPSETSTSEGTRKSKWLFGLQQPTALDAHLIVFIARMRDVGMSAIIPEALGVYADRAMVEKEWHKVMGSRKTMMAK